MSGQYPASVSSSALVAASGEPGNTTPPTVFTLAILASAGAPCHWSTASASARRRRGAPRVGGRFRGVGRGPGRLAEPGRGGGRRGAGNHAPATRLRVGVLGGGGRPGPRAARGGGPPPDPDVVERLLLVIGRD